MKLLAGAVAYLSVVTILVVVAFASLSTIERGPPDDATAALGSSADHETTGRARVDEAKADADRVPVWIAPTTKYVYTPVPVDLKPKPAPVIGKDARAAMAKASRADGRRAIERALRDQGRGSALGFTRSRDNDPFFRD